MSIQRPLIERVSKILNSFKILFYAGKDKKWNKKTTNRCSRRLVIALCGVCMKSFARCQARDCNFLATVHNNCTINSTSSSKLYDRFALDVIAPALRQHIYVSRLNYVLWDNENVSLWISLPSLCQLVHFWHSRWHFSFSKRPFPCSADLLGIDTRAQKCCLPSPLMLPI